MNNVKLYIPSSLSVLFLFLYFTPLLLDRSWYHYSIFLMQISSLWFFFAMWILLGLKIITFLRSERSITYNKHKLISLLIFIMPFTLVIIAWFKGYAPS